MDEENKENYNPLFRKNIKEMEEKNYHITSIISRANKILQSVENLKTSDYKDINNILSDYAQTVIQDSKGPLKPDKLFNFLLNEVFGKQNKEVLPSIRKYSTDIEGVWEQVFEAIDKIEAHMKYRKHQKNLDDRFIKKMKILDKTMREEFAKEKQSNKKQTIVNQYFSVEKVHINVESLKVSDCTNKSSRKRNIPDASRSSKQVVFQKKAAKNSRKRKLKENVGNPSKKKKRDEREVTQLTSKIKRCLALSSLENITESRHNIESESAVGLDGVGKDTEPMSVADLAESCSQHTELMSIVDSESSSSQHTEPMSVSSNSETDAMSIDNPSSLSSELSETSTEHSESELDSDLESLEGEKTVSERQFCFRGKPFR